MDSPILGVHAFYTTDVDNGRYKSVELLCQLASALYWRKNFGPIGLFISPEREFQLIHYGLHNAYSFVDTIQHEKVVMSGDPRFWAYPKMLIAKNLSLEFERFCMLDADLYIKNREFFNIDAQLLTYHMEKTDMPNFPELGYVPGKELYDFAGLKSPIKNWESRAVNTALLYCNGIPGFIQEWMTHVDDIIANSYKWEIIKGSGDQIFVEQYLLYNLAKERGISVQTYLNSEWLPGKWREELHTDPTMSGWAHYEDTEIVNKKFDNIFHIWGLKHSLTYGKVRTSILGRILSDLDRDFPNLDKSYPILLAEARELYKDKSDHVIGILSKDNPKEIKNGKSKKLRPTTNRKDNISS